jgi:hypothetical protein
LWWAQRRWVQLLHCWRALCYLRDDDSVHLLGLLGDLIGALVSLVQYSGGFSSLSLLTQHPHPPNHWGFFGFKPLRGSTHLVLCLPFLLSQTHIGVFLAPLLLETPQTISESVQHSDVISRLPDPMVLSYPSAGCSRCNLKAARPNGTEVFQMG